MRNAWRLGKVFGIDIYIDASWIIIFMLVTWTLAGEYFPSQNADWSPFLNWSLGIIASLLFFSSVLAHELSHSLVAIQQGEQVKNITLFIFGGVAQIAEEPDEPLKEFLIASVGPLTSIVIGVFSGIAWWLSGKISPPAASIFSYLCLINIALACFNLVPGFPLDGGRILRAIIWGYTKNVKIATKIASFSGKLVAFLLISLGIITMFRLKTISVNGIWFILIGWFLYNAANRSYRHLLLKDALREVKVEDLMITSLDTVPPTLSIQRLVDDYIMRHRDHGFLVVDEGMVQGIVCLADVKKLPKERWPTTPISEIMLSKELLEKVSPEENANVALGKLTAKNIHQIPVVQENRVRGILRRNDILNYIQLHAEVRVK
ncbi:MAG: site-2 protease family protein [Deltaproteobacteria bacterium]|nr:site-2 protease family protein [Deltaproteobacteria bacterium]